MSKRKAVTPAIISIILALIAGLLLSAVPQPAQAATVGPGNRQFYVFTFMSTRPNGTVLRIGTMHFQPNGWVYQRYWQWNQAWATSPASLYRYRTRTGYTTRGCPGTSCEVWTAAGFTGGGYARSGKWRLTNRGTRLQINFGARWQIYEVYTVANFATYSRLNLSASNYPGFSRFFGSAYGSKASLSRGATMDQIRGRGSPTQNGIKYRMVTDNWNSRLEFKRSVMWWNSPGNYRRCSGTCIKGVAPHRWHSYLIADPPRLGRKMYWYNMLASVAHSRTCANPRYGGHTIQLLQVLDDNGRFIGMVGGEASIMGRYRGGSIMSMFVGIRF